MSIDWDTFEYPDRDTMIEWLCDTDKEYIMDSDGGLELLYSYLQFGFKGYEQFTDKELQDEYRDRTVMREFIGGPV